jgi:formamidopyrimidine-DNA glycosylase
MLELPEIEVLRRDLEREYVGKKIKEVDATSMQVLGRYRNRKQFTDQLAGRKVKSIHRRATLLVFDLDGTDALVLDLGTQGRLLKAKTARASLPPDTQLVFSFASGGPLRFVDSKGDADAFVVPLEDLAKEVPKLAHLGFDPLDSPMSWQAFGHELIRRDQKLKPALMDDTFIAGIGPMYADEILFEAGLRFDRDSAALSPQEIRRLYRAVIEVLSEAVKHRGVSAGSDGFVDLAGRPGGFQDHLQVWGREGEPCPRCRKPIEKSRIAGKVTYFSPSQV